MIPKLKIILFSTALIIISLACGQFEINIESDPSASPMEAPTNTPTLKVLQTENPEQSHPTDTTTAIENTSAAADESQDNRLDCSQFGADPLVSISCNIQDSFISRNTQPLLSYMPEEFGLGFWQSEWSTVTPEYALQYFQETMLPPDPQSMTFTVDRDEFPPLFGAPPETMLGPDTSIALVIYSEGWGADGQGAVLIFIAEYPTGGYYFPAILVAPGNFDK